jgi:hypothetical protein
MFFNDNGDLVAEARIELTIQHFSLNPCGPMPIGCGPATFTWRITSC